MAKGVPTDRSQRFKANKKLQEKTKSITKEKVYSTPSTSGNDVLPSPTTVPSKPVILPEGAQQAFELGRVLTQTLMHMNPTDHISDILKLLSSSISDCLAWYKEMSDRNNALQHQLDDLNSKFLGQDSEILNLQDQLAKCQATKDFYRQQVLQTDMSPPRRRYRFVSPDTAVALSSDQLFHHLLLARDDIQVRDATLARLQNKHS